MPLKRYKFIKKYSMKCRLYPNKEQQKQIDNLLYGKAVAYNMVLYNFKQYMFSREKQDDENPDQVVHFPDFGAAVKGVELDKLRLENEYVNYVPGGVLSGKSGVIADLKRAYEKTGKHPIEQWDHVKKNKDGTEQHFGPRYHSKHDNHLSMAYQTRFSNIVATENRNVLKVRINSQNYTVDGLVKIRGWNQGLRFDENLQTDFLDWIMANQKSKTKLTIRIERDLDRYYIIFTLNNVYRPYTVEENRNPHIGIDVGEITLAAMSDETSYKNVFDHNPKFQRTIDTIDYLKTVKSRRWGYSNQEFIKERNKKRKEREKNKELNEAEVENRNDENIQPSKRYMKTQKRIYRLYSRRSDIMNTYYNNVTADILKNNIKVNAETLNVKEMFWWKEKQKNEKAKKEQNKKADSETQQKPVECCDQ